jgi:cell division protein FtsL
VNKLIVAKERQYYQTIPDIQQQPNIGAKKTARRNNVSLRKRKALVRVFFVLAVGILVISPFAVISECNYNIRMLERELQELQMANERLQLQHAQAMDINYLEDYALHQLGMVYPDNRDIVYVAVKDTGNEILAAEQQDEGRAADSGWDGWFAVLVGKASSMFNND